MNQPNANNTLRLRLSPIYSLTTHYGVVYHTQPGSEEVEFVTDKLFLTRKKAEKWFRLNRKPEDYIEPEVVEVHVKYLGVNRS